MTAPGALQALHKGRNPLFEDDAPRPSDEAAAGGKGGKRRRHRVAQSCMSCVVRKIKCDRNVPGCNSCVIRGIADQCRWGDERDNDFRTKESDGCKKRRGSKQKRRGSEEKSSSSNSASHRALVKKRHGKAQEIDEIVEAVMKRMKNSKRKASQSSSESEESDESEVDSETEGSERLSMDEGPSVSASSRTSYVSAHSSKGGKKTGAALDAMLRFDVVPPVNSTAGRIEMSAFRGDRKSHPFFYKTLPEDEDDFCDCEIVKESVSQLPRLDLMKALVNSYLEELEPLKNVFNRSILAQQMEELWMDFEEMGIRTGEARLTFPPQAGSRPVAEPMDFVFLPTTKDVTLPSNKIRHRLFSRGRQGLIALMFTLCDLGARMSEIDRLIILGIAPSIGTEEYMLDWSRRMTERSKLHLGLSNFIAKPTIWALQILLLNDMSASAMARWGGDLRKSFEKHFGSSSLSIHLCFSLGLNNLGSAYEDVRQLKRANKASASKGAHEGREQAKEGVTDIHAEEKKITLSSMQNGTWIAEFEPSNLAHRELGRKLWCMVSVMDALMAGHFHQFHSIHKGIDHTSPPAPVDDEDLLSPFAAELIEQSRPDAVLPRDNSFLAFYSAIAGISRSQVEMENVKGSPLPYGDLVALDDRFHELLDNVPAYFRLQTLDLQREPKPESQPIYAHSPSTSPLKKRTIALQRYVINDQIYFRMLRMHRMHLGKGFKDKRFRRSTESCLEAARGILSVRVEIEKSEHTMRHALFLMSHLLAAAFVFKLFLLHEVDGDRHLKSKPSSTTKRKAKSKLKDDESEDYRLDDVDATVAQLEACIEYLCLAPRFSMAKDQINAIKTYFENVKGQLRHTNHKAASLPSISKKYEAESHHPSQSRTAHTHAPLSVDLCGPNPITSAIQSGLTEQRPPFVQSPTSWYSNGSTQQQPTFTTPSSIATQNTSFSLPSTLEDDPTLNVYDPSLWSLEALFPDYASGEIDLISAMEKEVFSGDHLAH